jgi:hypothetical protein
VSVWETSEINGSQVSESIIPWRTWPHVGIKDDKNEIWIDVENDVITNVWINRELLHLDPTSVPGRKFGYWHTSYGEPGAVTFDYLEIYSEE